MSGAGRRAWRLLGVLSLLLLCMCRACWLPSRGTDRAVRDAELVGTWVLTGASLVLLERDGYPAPGPADAHTIVLRRDGSAALRTVVERPDGIEPCVGDATWHVERDERGTRVVLRITPDGIEPGPLGIDEDEDGLVLFEFLGDPDSWEFLEYRRAR